MGMVAVVAILVVVAMVVIVVVTKVVVVHIGMPLLLKTLMDEAPISLSETVSEAQVGLNVGVDGHPKGQPHFLMLMYLTHLFPQYPLSLFYLIPWSH